MRPSKKERKDMKTGVKCLDLSKEEDTHSLFSSLWLYDQFPPIKNSVNSISQFVTFNFLPSHHYQTSPTDQYLIILPIGKYTRFTIVSSLTFYGQSTSKNDPNLPSSATKRVRFFVQERTSRDWNLLLKYSYFAGFDFKLEPALGFSNEIKCQKVKPV